MPARIVSLYISVVTLLGFKTANKRYVASGAIKKPEEVIDNLHGIFEHHLSSLPTEEQARRWNALEEYVKKVGSAGTLAKR
jgi:hypothetical protein